MSGLKSHKTWPLTVTIICIFVACAAQGAEKSLPRFVTIRSEQVNSRVGPGLQYPLANIFVKKGEPVEVITEAGNWRQVKDVDGHTSWIHVSLLSSKRSVIVKSAVPVSLFKTPFKDSVVVANVFSNFRCQFLDYCYLRFCKVKCDSHKGWVDRSLLWGVYDHEFKECGILKAYFKTYF